MKCRRPKSVNILPFRLTVTGPICCTYGPSACARKLTITRPSRPTSVMVSRCQRKYPEMALVVILKLSDIRPLKVEQEWLTFCLYKAMNMIYGNINCTKQPTSCYGRSGCPVQHHHWRTQTTTGEKRGILANERRGKSIVMFTVTPTWYYLLGNSLQTCWNNAMFWRDVTAPSTPSTNGRPAVGF